MSNLRNLQGLVIKMASQLNHVTQTKHESRQTMETKDTCFREESFIDGNFYFFSQKIKLFQL